MLDEKNLHNRAMKREIQRDMHTVECALHYLKDFGADTSEEDYSIYLMALFYIGNAQALFSELIEEQAAD